MALRRIVPSPSWRRRVGRAELAAPNRRRRVVLDRPQRGPGAEPLVRRSGGRRPPEAESILVTGCPTEPTNLVPFQKCPFELRYTQQSLTENSMRCHGPLVSELGEQSAWCPPGPVPRGSAAYVTLSVQHPHTLRAHELKFHVATKHEQPLLGYFSRLPCVSTAKCCRGKHYARSKRHLLMRRRRLRASRRPI